MLGCIELCQECATLAFDRCVVPCPFCSQPFLDEALEWLTQDGASDDESGREEGPASSSTAPRPVVPFVPRPVVDVRLEFVKPVRLTCSQCNSRVPACPKTHEIRVGIADIWLCFPCATEILQQQAAMLSELENRDRVVEG